MSRLRLLLSWTGNNARGLAALLSLLSLAAGFWLAWPPLGLIVPGAVVFGCLAYSHVRGEG